VVNRAVNHFVNAIGATGWLTRVAVNHRGRDCYCWGFVVNAFWGGLGFGVSGILKMTFL